MIGGRKNMNKTVLIIGIMFLLIGASVVSSMKTVENKYSIEEKLSSGKIAYGSCAFSPFNIVKFPLNDPGNIEIIAPGDNQYFLAGGTWTCDGEWYGCEYNSGGLWKIDPDSGSMENIGGGGTSCNGLSWDPVYNKLYGVSGSGLYEYDPDTGEQEFIGSIIGPNSIMGIAFDGNGTLYAWDDNLWIIETFEATLVGPLGIWAGDGHFDYDTDILYLSTFISTGQLYECDKETGNCTLIGNFEGCAEITCLAIPYNCSNIPPVTTISFDPPYPDGENGWYVSNVTATLNATDTDGVDATYYRISSGDWNIYYSPFIISEEGDDILIEYYSIDNLGNVEDVKSAFLDIDKTPPNVTVEIEVKKIGCGKWLLIITITSHDNSSGMDRVEFFLNDGLQSVVSGSGPSYSWSWVMYGPISFDIKVIIYDCAGNSFIVIINETDISYPNLVKHIFTQRSINPLLLKILDSFPLLERFLIHSNGGRI
jgi:hypothetical protein